MAVEITMPQLSDTMNDGKILAWHKKEGDKIKRGDALAEVATDKADLEIESFHEGTLLKIYSPAGTTVKVGEVIAVVGEEGATVSPQPQTNGKKGEILSSPRKEETLEQGAQKLQTLPSPVMSPQKSSPEEAVSSPQETESERIKISPLARNIADSHGVDYRQLAGTGEGGRITKRDIESQLDKKIPEKKKTAIHSLAPTRIGSEQARDPSTSRAQDTIKEKTARPQPESPRQVSGEPLSKMRQAIASRMVESTTTIPHFYSTTKIHADALVRLKNSVKPLMQYEGLTYNHLIIRAAALALKAVPRVNASYQENLLVQPSEINIGIVTAVPDGLLIPVLRQADELPLVDVVSEARALVQRARSGRPKSSDLSGGTFSISNMGMFPVESFTAIINPGQGAILAVSAIQEEPIVVQGQVTIGKTMKVTLSVDHRIIDGVMAGEFLKELQRVLEDPILLLA